MTEQTYKSATPEQHERQKNGQGLTAKQIAAAGINKDDHPKHFVDYSRPKDAAILELGSVKETELGTPAVN